MINKIKLLVLIPLVIAGLAIALWKPVAGALVHSFLKRSSLEVFDSDFQSGGIYKKDETWVVDKPQIANSKDIYEGGILAQADQLLINYALHLWERKLEVEFILVNPRIELSQIDVEALVKRYSQASHFFEIQGHVSVQNGELIIHSKESSQDHSIYFQLKKFSLSDPSGHAEISFGKPSKEKNVLLISKDKENSFFKLDCRQVDCALLSKGLHALWPTFLPLEIKSGLLDGQVSAILTKAGWPLSQGHLTLEDFTFSHAPSHWEGVIREARLKFGGEETLDRASLNISKEANFIYYQNGSPYFEIKDLKGALTLDSQNQAHALFKGLCLHHGLKYDLSLEGVGALSDNSQVSTDLICRLNSPIAEEITLRLIGPQIGVEVKNLGKDELEVIQAIFSERSSYLNLFHILDGRLDASLTAFGRGLTVSKLQVKQIHARQLKFDAPFLKTQGKVADIKGDFALNLQEENLWEGFDGELTFEKGNLTVNGLAPFPLEFSTINAQLTVERGVVQKSQIEGGLAGMHGVIDITGYSPDKFVEGILPVRNGTLSEKNNGLVFTDINAQVHFEKDRIRIPEIETYCKGIYFTGDVDIYNGPSTFNVDIHADTMLGKVSQVQPLFSPLSKIPFFLKLPLDGNVELREKGGHLHFAFQPGDYKLSATIQGALTEGTFALQNSDMAAQEISLNFDYDHAANRLDFFDIQGTLLVGDPNHVEEYTITGDHILFTNLEKNQAEFDVWIGDKKRDVFRVVGKTIPSSKHKDPDTIEFILDYDRSHFGAVYPRTFQLTLKDWTQIETFQLSLRLNLATLFHDLQRFSRTGLLFLSRKLLKELNGLKTAEGEFTVNLQYDNKPSQLNYEINGEEIAIGRQKFKKFQLTGRKKDNLWSIDQMLLDDLALASDFLRTENSWKLNFLGIRYGQSFLMGMEGEYKDGDKALKAQVNLLEMDLAHLDEWPAAKIFYEQYKPRGYLRANGQIQIEPGKGSSGLKVDALLNASLQDGSFKNLVFKDTQNISCHFVSDRGIALQKISTNLISGKNKTPQATFYLKKINYDSANQEIALEGVHFNVPSENLNWLAGHLGQSFPEIFTPPMGEIIRHIKKEGSVEGEFNLEFGEPHYALHLALNDGLYSFQGREYDLKDFTLDYNPSEFKLLAQNHYQQHSFWGQLRSTPAFDAGELILSDGHPDSSQKPLVISWLNNSRAGCTVQKAAGEFAGMSVSLVKSEEAISQSHQQLIGEVKLDLRQASSLFSPEIRESVKRWEMGDGYTLKGKWKFSKNLEEENLGVDLDGFLEGRNFEFKGYQLDHLTAQLKYTPQSIHVQNLTLLDPAGTLHIDEIRCEKEEQQKWKLSIPNSVAKDFRPSLLRKAGSSSQSAAKPFTIRQFELQNLKGDLADANSLTGRGKLCFANPPKKNTQNSLFAIPAEIAARTGLDIAALNPVTGTIFYDIKNGKVFLTRFKDLFSEGKLSKFYLSNANPSYVDFDGNLHVQVKMKQSNLLFKLADLFTINIQGTLQKPTYTLQTQHEEKEGE